MFTKHCFNSDTHSHKIRTTWHHMGCKLFHKFEDCSLNHKFEDCSLNEFKLCPAPIPIPRKADEKFMKYEALNANRDLLHHGLDQHGRINPSRDFNRLFEENLLRSYRKDLDKIDHINPTKILEWRSAPFSLETKEIIHSFWIKNPSRLSSIESQWIKKLKGIPARRKVQRILNAQLMTELKPNWKLIQRNEPTILAIDDTKSIDGIWRQIPLGQIRSVLENVTDETETDDVVNIKALIRLIKTELDNEKKKEQKRQMQQQRRDEIKKKKMEEKRQRQLQQQRQQHQQSSDSSDSSEETDSSNSSTSASDASDSSTSSSGSTSTSGSNEDYSDMNMVLINGQYEFAI
eukprot:908010_1